MGASPIRLSDLGKKMASRMNAEDWARSESELLIGSTKGKDQYEIQESAFKHAEKFSPDDDLAKEIRASAFVSGLKLEDSRRVLGVVLRDALFKIHGITSEGYSEP